MYIYLPFSLAHFAHRGKGVLLLSYRLSYSSCSIICMGNVAFAFGIILVGRGFVRILFSEGNGKGLKVMNVGGLINSVAEIVYFGRN